MKHLTELTKSCSDDLPSPILDPHPLTFTLANAPLNASSSSLQPSTPYLGIPFGTHSGKFPPIDPGYPYPDAVSAITSPASSQTRIADASAQTNILQVLLPKASFPFHVSDSEGPRDRDVYFNQGRRSSTKKLRNGSQSISAAPSDASTGLLGTGGEQAESPVTDVPPAYRAYETG